MLPERTYRVNYLVRACVVLGALASLAGLGCATGLSDGRFSKPGVRYDMGGVPPGFRAVHLRENDLAFVQPRHGQSIALNSTCEGYDDASLEVLTHHLLMGFTDINPLDQHHALLDGRDSLRTHVAAKLDGVPQELTLVVLKKDGCIYDLTYLSAPGLFDDELPAFERVLERFHVEGTRP